MPFPTALTSPNYTSLRAGGHKADQYLLLGSNTTVFAARVNQATSATSFGNITYDTVTTGAYTDILEGMTVLISATNDKRAAYFVGRIRANNSGVVSTSTLIVINETSAAIADNDYIFVIRDYRLFHELGRYVGGVYFKDYARTFFQLRPIIYGLQSVYAGVVSGSPSGFTVAFAASAIAATSGATISSYAYTLPSGTTVTAGSISTANVTVRFDASTTEYWVRLIVTDSGGRTQTRYIAVFAIPSDLSSLVYLGANGANIQGDVDNGFSATVDVFTGFSSVLDNTLAVVLDVEYYGATQSSIFSAVKFVGRIRTDTDPTQASETISVSHKASVEIEGAAAQMARITTPLITMRDKASATVWDEIFKLTIWRSVTYLLEHSTFHTLYSLSFDSTSDTFLAYQLAAAQGNLLSGANDLLKSINASLEFSPTGEVRAVRHIDFLSTSARNALTVVADFETQDGINFAPKYEHVETIGLVEGSGGTYNRAGGVLAAMVTPYLSVAPGVAQGNAEGTSPLPGQILAANATAAAAKTELNERTANQFAQANAAFEMTVDLRTGYNWIVPSRYQYYTWTLAAGDTVFGRAFTTSDRWWVRSVSVRHDNITGKKEVQAVFALETSGSDAGIIGQNVPIPAPTTIPPVLPPIPPVVAYPNFPPLPDVYLPNDPTPDQLPPYVPVNTIPVDGNAVIYWSELRVWYCINFLGLNTPVEITPTNSLGTITDCALVGQRIYVISTDGTDSICHSAPNAFTPTITYTDTDVAGMYTSVRPTSTDGALYLIGTAVVSSLNPADAYSIFGASHGTILSRTNSTITVQATQVGGMGDYYILLKTPDQDTCTYFGGYTIDSGSVSQAGNASWTTCGVAQVEGVPEHVFGILGNDVCINYIQVQSNVAFTLTITFTADEDCFPTVAGDLQTVYSTDYAASFASAVTVDTTGGAGLDTIKIGVPVLAGGEAQVKIATSAGGAYSAYGSATPTGTEPTALVIPRYQFGSTSTSNAGTNTPQYLMASSVLGTGNKAVLKVTASGATFTDITPQVSSDFGIALGARCIAMPWRSGSRIAAVLMFGSSPRLVVSTNAGAAWTDRGILNANAVQVAYRNGDTTMQQLFLTNGSPAYSPSHGASIISKAYPGDSATEPILGILPYG